MGTRTLDRTFERSIHSLLSLTIALITPMYVCFKKEQQTRPFECPFSALKRKRGALLWPFMPSCARAFPLYAEFRPLMPSCASSLPLYAKLCQVVPALFPFMPKFAKLCPRFSPSCRNSPSCASTLPLYAKLCQVVPMLCPFMPSMLTTLLILVFLVAFF